MHDFIQVVVKGHLLKVNERVVAGRKYVGINVMTLPQVWIEGQKPEVLGDW